MAFGDDIGANGRDNDSAHLLYKLCSSKDTRVPVLNRLRNASGAQSKQAFFPNVGVLYRRLLPAIDRFCRLSCCSSRGCLSLCYCNLYVCWLKSSWHAENMEMHASTGYVAKDRVLTVIIRDPHPGRWSSWHCRMFAATPWRNVMLCHFG